MANLIHLLHFALSLNSLCSFLTLARAKSTIEPCLGSDTCDAMVGYVLPTDLKVSEIATLFSVDPIALLAANAFDASVPDAASRVLPRRLFLRVPVRCPCIDGIRRVASVTYRARASDTLDSIAASVYGSLLTADQISDANGLTGPDLTLLLGQPLDIPLPCSCFNRSDNGLPTVYLSYAVRPSDSLPAIAAQYSTTISDLMTVNALGSNVVRPGDILSIPLAACVAGFSKRARDAELIVPNGSYAVTAGHCVQCSCGPVNMNLYCMPAYMGTPCTSMQCKSSNLTVGMVSLRPTNSGCSVTSCNYGGFAKGTILASLSTSLQTHCPGPHSSLSLLPLPSPLPETAIAPSPADDAGGAVLPPRSSSSETEPLTGVAPAVDPSGSTSRSSPLPYSFCHFVNAMVLYYFLRFII